jgi:hypothetical protein
MNTKMKVSLISLSMVILMVAGCKKDSNILTTKMSATIDGTKWNSTLRETLKKNTGFVITAQQVSTTLVTSMLVININGFTTDTYNVGLASNSCLATYTPNISTASDSYVSATGTVTLTEVNTTDKTISGTFTFTCGNVSLKTVSITDGSFTGMKYTETSGD